jgi:hypothetical protein
MSEIQKDELMVSEETKALSTDVQTPMGFEDENEGDMIIPRIKVINALSPEKKEKLADDGDVINSLTKDKLNGKAFIPVFKFNSNIWWKPRSEGGGIQCHARDGKTATATDGTIKICAQCKKNEFDNTKTGKDSFPVCTKYISFFGFVAGERIPIILSFAKTNFNEGKKMYSLAKVTMQNMWHHGYFLNSKMMAKGGNEWYNIVASPSGATSEEDRQFGAMLYKNFRNANLNVDMDENTESVENAGPSAATMENVNSAEF